MNYQETFDKRLEEQKKAVASSPIMENIEISKINDNRADEIMEKMSEISGKPVYADFAWRTGKIIGILRHIFQNPKKRKELLMATGLSSAHIDLYYQVMGNLPYVRTTTNTLDPGRPMNCELAKQLIKAVGAELGILVEDSDLIDITDSNWQRLYDKAMEDALQTIEFNKQNANINYEE